MLVPPRLIFSNILYFYECMLSVVPSHVLHVIDRPIRNMCDFCIIVQFQKFRGFFQWLNSVALGNEGNHFYENNNPYIFRQGMLSSRVRRRVQFGDS